MIENYLKTADNKYTICSPLIKSEIISTDDYYRTELSIKNETPDYVVFWRSGFRTPEDAAKESCQVAAEISNNLGQLVVLAESQNIFVKEPGIDAFSARKGNVILRVSWRFRAGNWRMSIMVAAVIGTMYLSLVTAQSRSEAMNLIVRKAAYIALGMGNIARAISFAAANE